MKNITKKILLIFFPLFGTAQTDYFKDIRNDKGFIVWEKIKTSELSMDFHYTLGTSEQYHNHQQKIRVLGLAELANLSSVYDCEKEWAEIVNSNSFIKHHIVVTDTIAFTKNHKIFNFIRKDDYTYYSTYGEFAFKDYNVKGDFNDDGYIDQLIFYSFLKHDKGTVINTLWQSYGEDFPWREFQGFGLVTKYNKNGNFHLINIGLEVSVDIVNNNSAVADRIYREKKLFKR